MDFKNIISTIDGLAKDDDNVVFLHDSFDIELSEDFVIETGVVGFTEDGIVLEADDETIEFLELHDIILEDETTEGKRYRYSEGSTDTVYPNAKVINSKKGKPVGEIYPDGDRWGAFHYGADRGYDGIDSKDEAIEALRELHNEVSPSRYEQHFSVEETTDNTLEDAKPLYTPYEDDLADIMRLTENPNPGDFNQASKSPIGSINYNDEERMADANITGKDPEVEVHEAEYQGRKVTLNKPMQGDVKKSKVYVKNAKGNVVKVNFGDKNMKIKKNIPGRRKSFRARHNCDNPGPKWKARYWSCRAW